MSIGIPVGEGTGRAQVMWENGRNEGTWEKKRMCTLGKGLQKLLCLWEHCHWSPALVGIRFLSGNLKRGRERMHLQLLAPGSCSSCSLSPRASSCFIFPPSCQCNVCTCFCLPIISSFAVPFKTSLASPQSLPQGDTAFLCLTLQTMIHRGLNELSNSAVSWFTR